MIIIHTGEKKIHIKSGDIVSINYIKKNKIFLLSDYKLLNESKINPVTVKDFAYYKLNKNDKKLISILYKRQKFFQTIRDFFFNNGFLEIHSPSLVESPGIERHIEPFITECIDFFGNKIVKYLPTSPEFSLKEALSGGLEKIFEIAKVFRNKEDNSKIHKHEFFMLEWYRAYDNYEILMDDCLKLIQYLSKKIYKTNKIQRLNKVCRVDKIIKIKLKDLFKNYNIDLDDYSVNPDKFVKEISILLKISSKEINDNCLSKEDLFFKFYLNNIEHNLGFDYPTIVYEYPAEMASLSRLCPGNELYAERFELYIFGIEIANAYGELIDPIEQEKRFLKDLQFRNKKSNYKLELPERFLTCLKHGLPPSSGIALGIERLFMLFEGLDSLEEANLW